MSLRIASQDDFDLVYSMALKFALSNELSKYVEEDKIKALVEDFLASPNEQKIILLHGEVGFLAAFIQPVLLGSAPQACEIAWWVEPEARSQGIGKILEEAFVFWATKLGCKLVSMACYDERTVKYFEKVGWKPYEYAVIKEL
jgi:GNAT superfamily N-acetyltransferase